MATNIKLFTDGGSRNNPGPAGIGGVVYEGEQVLFTFSKYIGIGTNNQAEYKALIEGLSLLKEKGIRSVDCFLDSELVVKQLNGLYKMRNEELRPLYDQVLGLVVSFSHITLNHVRREQNKLADKLVNEALDNAAK